MYIIKIVKNYVFLNIFLQYYNMILTRSNKLRCKRPDKNKFISEFRKNIPVYQNVCKLLIFVI